MSTIGKSTVLKMEGSLEPIITSLDSLSSRYLKLQ